MIRGLSLFSGYAGIDLALAEYVKPIAYVEIEPYVQKVIAYRMADGLIPRAAILGDVKNVQGEFGDCDIIYGGFPCQDLSVAGTGKGLAGERSGLFFEIIRLVSEIRPRFVFLENVPAITVRGLDRVGMEFAALGYDCRWTVVSAASVGAPHLRERWFLMAYPMRERLQGGANAGSRSESWKRPAKQLERLQPTDFWTQIPMPEINRVVHGIDCRVDRIKAIGNGVVPAQVRAAFKHLLNLTNPA